MNQMLSIHTVHVSCKSLYYYAVSNKETCPNEVLAIIIDILGFEHQTEWKTTHFEL